MRFTIRPTQIRPNLATPLSRIEHQYSEISAEWNSSALKRALVRKVEENILTQKDLFINAALCLGLGSFGASSIFGFDEDFTTEERDTCLRQLLAFETVVACLRMRSYILLQFELFFLT